MNAAEARKTATKINQSKGSLANVMSEIIESSRSGNFYTFFSYLSKDTIRILKSNGYIVEQFHKFKVSW